MTPSLSLQESSRSRPINNHWWTGCPPRPAVKEERGDVDAHIGVGPPDRRDRPRGGPRRATSRSGLTRSSRGRSGSVRGRSSRGMPASAARWRWAATTSSATAPCWARARSIKAIAASRRRSGSATATSSASTSPSTGGPSTAAARPVIGDRNMFMIGSHLGHDAKVGNDCTLVNGSLVAGHVELHDGCILSGHTRDPAAGPGRPAGDARRSGLGDQGHPAVRDPAGIQLRLGPQPRRAPTGRRLSPMRSPRSGSPSGCSTRKAGPRPAPWS